MALGQYDESLSICGECRVRVGLAGEFGTYQARNDAILLAMLDRVRRGERWEVVRSEVTDKTCHGKDVFIEFRRIE